MLTEAYLAFLAATAVIIIIPGPTNLTIVADSIAAGLKKSLWTVLGAAVSHIVFIGVATAGVAATLTSYPNVFVFIKWFGVAYLCFQGGRILFRRTTIEAPGAATAGTQASHRYLIKGFLVNTTNPKALLFYAALFPPFVNPKMAYFPQLVILSLTFIGIFAIVGIVHAILGFRAKEFFQTKRNADLENKISGSVIIGAAVWMATK
jgi:homoserine/homoserine lactone efflux protein